MKLNRNFWARRLFEFDAGRYYGVSMIQFCILLAIFLKTYIENISWRVVVILFFGSMGVIWLAGFIMVKSGFYEAMLLRNPVSRMMLDKLEKK